MILSTFHPYADWTQPRYEATEWLSCGSVHTTEGDPPHLHAFHIMAESREGDTMDLTLNHHEAAELLHELKHAHADQKGTQPCGPRSTPKPRKRKSQNTSNRSQNASDKKKT